MGIFGRGDGMTEVVMDLEVLGGKGKGKEKGKEEEEEGVEVGEGVME